MYKIGVVVESTKQHPLGEGYTGVVVATAGSPDPDYPFCVRFNAPAMTEIQAWCTPEQIQRARLWIVTANAFAGAVYLSYDRTAAEDAAKGLFVAAGIDAGTVRRNDNTSHFTGSSLALDIQVWGLIPGSLVEMTKQMQRIKAHMKIHASMLNLEGSADTLAAAILRGEPLDHEAMIKTYGWPYQYLTQGKPTDRDESGWCTVAGYWPDTGNPKERKIIVTHGWRATGEEGHPGILTAKWANQSAPDFKEAMTEARNLLARLMSDWNSGEKKLTTYKYRPDDDKGQ